MPADQIIIIAVVAGAMAMFLWGKWRHDMVAMGALLVCVFTGLVEGSQAFAGFGHPAVVTVGCVLILSYGLQTTGAVDALAGRLLPAAAGPSLSILALTALSAVLSGFMNNVGALALLMPVAIQMADRLKLPPGKVLMPLAFGSILGGTTTLIGTPPNLIVATFRKEHRGSLFDMFDFLPVGAAIAGAGVLFLGFVGWRLVPARKRADSATFETAKYLSEARIPEGGKLAGKSVEEAEKLLDDEDAQLLGLVRNERRLSAPGRRRRLKAGDILVLEAEPESLGGLLSKLGLKLEEDVPVDGGEDRRNNGNSDTGGDAGADSDGEGKKAVAPGEAEAKTGGDGGKAGREVEEEEIPDEDIAMQELVAMPNTALLGRTATSIALRTRYGVNLLAISRKGRRSVKRLRATGFSAGDVLLVQGAKDSISEFAADYGCLPLAARDIRMPGKNRALAAGAIMAGAMGLTAFGVLPVAVAFSAAVLLFMALRIVQPKDVYTVVDWPVIVLLGAMIPVAGAIATTGLADAIAKSILEGLAGGDAVIALVMLLVATMVMTDFMNNAATAAVMSPIAISTAGELGVSADAFLMAIAIGASSSFLTPIGHQNNTLILSPGGFRFGDYWRLGLLTEVLVVAIAVPVLLVAWPLR